MDQDTNNHIVSLNNNLGHFIRMLEIIDNKDEKSHSHIVRGAGYLLRVIDYLYVVDDWNSIQWFVKAWGQFCLNTKDYSQSYVKPTPLITWLFLSGNEKAIEQFLDFEFELHGIPIGMYSQMSGPMVITQLLFKNKKEEAKSELEYWKQSESFKDSIAVYHQLVHFYEPLINGDIQGIKDSFDRIFTDDFNKVYIKHWGIGEKYRSSLACFCYKIALMLGYDFELEHPLIDHRLVNIEPVEEYPSIRDIINRLRNLVINCQST